MLRCSNKNIKLNTLKTLEIYKHEFQTNLMFSTNRCEFDTIKIYFEFLIKLVKYIMNVMFYFG